MATPATLERRRLADLLDQTGPDAPTLCGGWATRDLAAHLVVRERRPDALGGILLPMLSRYTDRVQQEYAAREWTELVELVRTGPPLWSPTRLGPIDKMANTMEFFVHHEDVRRAVDPWEPRDLDEDLADTLGTLIRTSARLLARSAPAGITLEPEGGRRFVGRGGDPKVAVRGPIGEIVMWLYGRQRHARVELDGPADAVARLQSASFGI